MLNSTLFDLQSLTEADNDVPTPYLEAYLRICQYCGFFPATAEGDEDYDLLKLKKVRELVFCVPAIVGTTFTAEKDPVADINTVLETIALDDFPYYTSNKIYIPIHVDAASGGFTLPFTDPDNNDWHFKHIDPILNPGGSSHVESINVSMHKFGMVYAGLGLVVYKNEDIVDSSLIYEITYLGASFYDFNVNFSRGSAMVIAGYYALIRNGLDGYKQIVSNCYINAQYLASELLALTDDSGNAYFTTISDNDKFPWVVFKFDTANPTPPSWTLGDLSIDLQESGWQLPQYQLPDNSSKTPDGPSVMRVVVRMDISQNKINLLIGDIKDAIANLENPAFDFNDPKVKQMLQKKRDEHLHKGPIGC
ncbi:MAG: hypothetical protein HRU28_04390 [Rhizobiales bacterium]|nr:hypothetical protein [Hyphomicrobiales bacterium]